MFLNFDVFVGDVGGCVWCMACMGVMCVEGVIWSQMETNG